MENKLITKIILSLLGLVAVLQVGIIVLPHLHKSTPTLFGVRDGSDCTTFTCFTDVDVLDELRTNNFLVSGTSTYNGAQIFNGPVTVSSTLNVKGTQTNDGATILNGTLTAKGMAIFTAPVEVSSTLQVDGQMNALGSQNLVNAAELTGPTRIGFQGAPINTTAQVYDTTNSSTLYIGKSTQNGCIVLGVSNTSTLVYISGLNVLNNPTNFATTTRPANCELN